MKRSIALLGLALAAVPLSGCVHDGYGYGGVGMGWTSYPYNVWYDGYYGPFYDGYWGTDGSFYYRLHDDDDHYRRGDAGHFRRNDTPPNPRFRSYEGTTHEPPPGTRMPHFPEHGERRDRR